MSILLLALLPVLLLALVGTRMGLAGRASGRARADLAALLARILSARPADPAMAGASVSLRMSRGRPPEVEVAGGSAHGRLALAAEIEALLRRSGGLADAAALPAPVRWSARLGEDGRLAR